MALSPDGWLCLSGEVAQSLPEWWLYKTEIFTSPYNKLVSGPGDPNFPSLPFTEVLSSIT